MSAASDSPEAVAPIPCGAHSEGKLQIPARPTWVKGHITLPGGRCLQNPSGGAASKAWPPGVMPAHLTLRKWEKPPAAQGGGGVSRVEGGDGPVPAPAPEGLPTKATPAWCG